MKNNIGSLRWQGCLLIIVAVMVPLIIVGCITYRLSKDAIVQVSLGQVQDTLEGGYYTVQQYYDKVQKGEMTKEQALAAIRYTFGGPVTAIWLKAGNNQELQECLALFGVVEQSEISGQDIKVAGQKVGSFNDQKKVYAITDPTMLTTLMKYYDNLNEDQQRAIINSKYVVRIIQDLPKATVHIRDTGYVWSISGNPGNRFEGKIFEVFHPSIAGSNIWDSPNFKGEQVGRTIASLNGKIDSAKDGEIVRYDYDWKNPTDPDARKKIVLLKYFRPWNIVIASGLYEDEFFSLLDQTKRVIIGGTLLFGILFCLIAFLAVSRVLKRVQHLYDISERVSQGDLNVEVDVTGRDELAMLSRSFGVMVQNLRNLIINSRDTAKTVEDTAQVLQDMCQQTSSSVEQVGQAVGDIANGASKQVELVEDSYQKVSMLARESKNIEQDAEDMNRATTEMKNVNQQGLGVIQDLMSKQDASKQSVTKIDEVIGALGKQIDKIREFTVMIAQIADQTNLLALNAAIEAARAGEQGRGFAVVAEEVRKLAEESSVASQDIQEVIGRIVQDREQALTAVQEAKESSDKQEDSVESTKTIFHQLEQSITGSITKIQHVYDEIKQLDQTKEQVVMAIQQISDVVSHSAAATQEVSATVQEQGSCTQEIHQRSEQLLQRAVDMRKMIEKFRLE